MAAVTLAYIIATLTDVIALSLLSYRVMACGLNYATLLVLYFLITTINGCTLFHHSGQNTISCSIPNQNLGTR